MINTKVEKPITLTEAAATLPRRKGGKPGNSSTVYRWSTVGCRGVVLETIQIGATRCTSLDALQRFFEKLSEPVARRALDSSDICSVA